MATLYTRNQRPNSVPHHPGYMSWTCYHEFRRFFGDMNSPTQHRRMRLHLETPLGILMSRSALSWHKLATAYFKGGNRIGQSRASVLLGIPMEWPLQDGRGTMVQCYIEYDIITMGYEYSLVHWSASMKRYSYSGQITKQEIENA